MMVKPRPRRLPSVTARFDTEYGHLYVTVSVDDEGQPFEVFGVLGKAGSLQRGMTELVCRLVSLHLRQGTSVESVVEQCEGVNEMQPWPNSIEGETVWIRGLGDALVYMLREEQLPPKGGADA